MSKVAALLASVLLSGQVLSACTVFFAFDGRLAIAGDNEDFDHTYTQMWSVPAAAGSYGVIYFGFGRGEYPKGGASMTARARQATVGLIPFNRLNIEDSYGLPQQGMNEKGLFFGGAETEVVEQSPRASRHSYDGIITDLVLRHAANVREALQILKSHDYALPEGQLLFADRSGDSFILEAGKLIVPGAGRYQVITNFLQSRHPEEKDRDLRYGVVNRRLGVGPQLSGDLIRSLLEDTQQSNTQYSTILDLTNLEVRVFERRDFSRAVTIRLREQLAKAPQVAVIGALFRR